MASTPTSQITRQITESAGGPNVLTTVAKFQITSYLVQGDTAITPRLETEKVMILHANGLLAA